MTITVRAERFAEAAAVSDIVKRAYAEVAHSDGREHLLVELLRATGAYVPQLSLIAEAEGTAIGHILLTRVFIGEAGVASLALAPLSVVPDPRGRGAGKRHVEVAPARARRRGVGLAGYSGRFGYEPRSRYPIALPFEAPAANSMILQLTPGALRGVSGVVRYPPEWMDH